jgi:hypothetical protein
MKYLIKTLLIILVATNAYAAKLIKIETKDFNKQVAFVFYHPDRQNLQITTIGKQVVVTNSSELKLTQINAAVFSKFASNLQLSKSNKGFSFKFLGEYSDFHKINGEKFTAIEFNISDKATAAKIKSPDKSFNKSSEISINRKGDDLAIHFPWSQNVGSAVFIKDQYLWVVFDKYKKFTLNVKDPAIASVLQLQDNEKTILKFKLLEQKNAKFHKDATGITVTLGKFADSIPGKNIKVVPFEADRKTLIEIQDAKMYKLHDQTSNQYIYVFTLQNSGKIHKSIDDKKYQILETSQGIAVTSQSQDIEINKHDQGILVGTKGRIINPDLMFEDVGDANNLLPICKLKQQEKNFIAEKLMLEKALTNNLPPKEMYGNILQLANLHFCYNMYQESLGALNIASIKQPELFRKDLNAYLLTAINLSLTNQYSKAKNIYEQIFSKLPEESIYPAVTLWQDYNEFKLNKNKSHINLLGNMPIITNYQDDLYFRIVLSGIESYLQDNLIQEAGEVYNIVRKTQDPKINNDLLFLKAQIYTLPKNNSLAKELYQTIIKNSKGDNFNLVRATIKLTNLEYLDKAITAQDAINTLNSLRFSWRGDAVEQDLLLSLVFYYKEINDKINALRTYKYIENCFENRFLDLEIAAETQSIALAIFSSDNIGSDTLGDSHGNHRSDLENVSLFLEFENYIPVDADGLKIIAQTAKQMMNLTLYESAIELLKRYIDKTSPQDKLEFADLIAESYLNSLKPQEAIKILEATDLTNTSFAEYIKRARLKALCYEAMGNLDKAISYLSVDDSIQSYPLKKRIYFKAARWQKFIDLIEDSVFESMQENIDDNKKISQDVIMLAISYASLDQKENLETLIGYLKRSPNLQKSLKNFSSLAKFEDDNLNAEDMQKFIDYYKKVF